MRNSEALPSRGSVPSSGPTYPGRGRRPPAFTFASAHCVSSVCSIFQYGREVRFAIVVGARTIPELTSTDRPIDAATYTGLTFASLARNSDCRSDFKPGINNCVPLAAHQRKIPYFNLSVAFNELLIYEITYINIKSN
jgi:hypothetical protein